MEQIEITLEIHPRSVCHFNFAPFHRTRPQGAMPRRHCRSLRCQEASMARYRSTIAQTVFGWGLVRRCFRQIRLVYLLVHTLVGQLARFSVVCATAPCHECVISSQVAEWKLVGGQRHRQSTLHCSAAERRRCNVTVTCETLRRSSCGNCRASLNAYGQRQ